MPRLRHPSMMLQLSANDPAVDAGKAEERMIGVYRRSLKPNMSRSGEYEWSLLFWRKGLVMNASALHAAGQARLPLRIQYLIVAAAAGVLCAGAGIAAVAAEFGKPAPVEPVKRIPGLFRPTAAELATLAIAPAGKFASEKSMLQATGTIDVDRNRSTPIFLPYSGQVTRVLVEPGQRVTRGQPLLVIRTAEFVEARDALATTAAQYQTAASQLRIAEANAQRQALIYKTAGGALKDYQQALNELVAARGGARASAAALSAARAKLAVLGKAPGEIAQLERGAAGTGAETVLRSPISGVIASRTVANGQYVGSGGDKPLFVVTDPSSVWLMAQVAETDARHVHVGDPVEVTTPAWPGRRFSARIAQVGAALDPETHRLPVRAAIVNSDGALKPEMFASFTIRYARADASQGLLIPASAVIYEGDSARVWVASAHGVLRARAIRVGEREDGMVHVIAGLKPGERIVTAGALFVNEAGTAS